jgi:hypothetical protein
MTAPDGKRFKEWNTAADGKGTSYKAGATVTMPGNSITLYAIWEDIPAGGGGLGILIAVAVIGIAVAVGILYWFFIRKP